MDAGHWKFDATRQLLIHSSFFTAVCPAWGDTRVMRETVVRHSSERWRCIPSRENHKQCGIFTFNTNCASENSWNWTFRALSVEYIFRCPCDSAFVFWDYIWDCFYPRREKKDWIALPNFSPIRNWWVYMLTRFWGPDSRASENCSKRKNNRLLDHRPADLSHSLNKVAYWIIRFPARSNDMFAWKTCLITIIEIQARNQVIFA